MALRFLSILHFVLTYSSSRAGFHPNRVYPTQGAARRAAAKCDVHFRDFLQASAAECSAPPAVTFGIARSRCARCFEFFQKQFHLAPRTRNTIYMIRNRNRNHTDNRNQVVDSCRGIDWEQFDLSRRPHCPQCKASCTGRYTYAARHVQRLIFPPCALDCAVRPHGFCRI